MQIARIQSLVWSSGILLATGLATSGAHAQQWIAKAGVENQPIELAAGVIVRAVRVPAQEAFPGKDSKPGAVAVRLSFQGPSTGYGLLIAVESSLATMRLTSGDHHYMPSVVDHPAGTSNKHLIEDLGPGMNMIQAKLTGPDHITFLYAPPIELSSEPRFLTVRIGLGTLLESSKGDFELKIQLPAK